MLWYSIQSRKTCHYILRRPSNTILCALNPLLHDFPFRSADATWLLYVPFLLDLASVNHHCRPCFMCAELVHRPGNIFCCETSKSFLAPWHFAWWQKKGSRWRMASKDVKVSPNFSDISRVSQSRFLSGSERLAQSPIFYKAVLESKSRSRIPKTSKSLVLQRKMLVLPSRKGSYLPCIHHP